ncbi:MAG: HDOD domain-containing protein [Myxococcota bacterium]|nr:HDOD domain-containing protein [Myxococcota bacterium]
MLVWLKNWLGWGKAPRDLASYQWSDAHTSPPPVRRGPEPVLPQVEVAPDMVEGPWLRGGVPSGSTCEEVRTALLRELYEEKERQAAPADRAFLERLIQSVGTEKLEFPPFPDVARQLDALLKERDPSMFQVVRLVEQDPALLRRVWLAGSSAAYSHPPSGLHHAIARIGFDALWRIGMAVCLHSQVFRVRGFQRRADEVRAHGIAVGELAAWIRDEKRGHHYLAGLLHDVGKLVVFRSASVKDGLDAPSRSVVEAIQDRHHPSLSLLAAHAWSLGDKVAIAAGFHHHPIAAPQEHHRIAQTLRAADIALHTAQEARRGRECGGLQELSRMEGLGKPAGQILEKAHALLERQEAEVVQEAEAPTEQAG